MPISYKLDRLVGPVYWYACKRIFSSDLIIQNGLAKEEIDNYLLKSSWFQDFARYAFQFRPEEFIQILLDEMIRSGAASWNNNYLIAAVSYQAPKEKLKEDCWMPGEFIL